MDVAGEQRAHGLAGAHHVEVAAVDHRGAVLQVERATWGHGVAQEGHVLIGFGLSLLGPIAALEVARGHHHRTAPARLDQNRVLAIHIGKRLGDGPTAGHHEVPVVFGHMPRPRFQGHPFVEQVLYHVGREVLYLAHGQHIGLHGLQYARKGALGRSFIHPAVHVPKGDPDFGAFRSAQWGGQLYGHILGQLYGI